MDKETAMKILKELYDNSLSAERTALKTIIPELKESKDERIKSVILKALLTDEAINILIECGIYYEDVESWLEKQGECCTGEADDGALEQQFQIWFEKGKCSGRDEVIFHPENFGLQKQGEQKLTDVYCQEHCKGYQEIGKCFADGECKAKMDSKNLSDNKPKFKVGNWYQCTKDFFGKGVTFDKNTAYYCAEEGCLQDEYGCHIAIVKDLYDNFKLWTIKDAKNGDVLYFSDETIVIFKDLYNATTFHSYCHIEDGLFDVSKDDMPDWWEGEGFQPATKEQRDILFRKMREAGYEWDSEKKELKKISQEYPLIPDECIKPTWSEEDIVAIDCAVEVLSKDLPSLAASIERLKSLRPQNRWKPTEEQLRELRNVFDASIGAWDEDVLESLYNDLIKL